jgi:vanillate/3-O-methylgallate O-demethylase
MQESKMAKYRRGVDVSTSWGKLEYTGWADEQASWKEACYVGDWSYLDELYVEGPDALRFFSDFIVNSTAKFAIGQAKHVICCNFDGKVIGEGILMRHGEQSFEFNARGPVTPWLEYNLKKGAYDAKHRCVIEHFKYQLSGPQSIFVAEKLTGSELRDIGFMHFRKEVIAGQPVFLLRQGMAGEIGFEIHGPSAGADAVYSAILEAGRAFGLRRMGARTAMINHLEAGFPTVTHDYLPAVEGAAEHEFFAAYDKPSPDDRGPAWFRSFERSLKIKGSFDADDISAWYRSPVELGWTRNIKFDHAFYGREALEKEVANPRRTIVSLLWNTDDCQDVVASTMRPGEPYDFMDFPRHPWNCMYACSVLKDGKPVGVATSRGFSHYFRQVLSHGVIDVEQAVPGTEVEVVWGDPGHRQKIIRAVVGPYPFKKDNRRADLAALPTAA